MTLRTVHDIEADLATHAGAVLALNGQIAAHLREITRLSIEKARTVELPPAVSFAERVAAYRARTEEEGRR